MLDYFEGKLSNEQIIALKAFAVLHPDLDLNFEEELVQLESETINFSGKQNLKVSFDDALVIGYLENTLTKEEKKEADALLKTNTVFINELNLYKKTIAQPDEHIVFENKSELKRKPKIIFFTQTVTLRVAAAILLLVGLWLLISNLFIGTPIHTPKLAKTEVKNAIATPNTKIIITPETNNEPNQLAAITHSKKNISYKKTSDVVNTVASTSVTVPSATLNTQPFIASIEIENTQVKPSYIDTNAMKPANEFIKEKTQRKVVIEEEADDEGIVANNSPKKGKLWDLASKALRLLNKNGIGKVNSSDNSNDLFIGALTISKNN